MTATDAGRLAQPVLRCESPAGLGGSRRDQRTGSRGSAGPARGRAPRWWRRRAAQLAAGGRARGQRRHRLHGGPGGRRGRRDRRPARDLDRRRRGTRRRRAEHGGRRVRLRQHPADTEQALLAKERRELAEEPEEELAELAYIYQQKGLSEELAVRVAEELTAHDALGAHAEAELGIDPDNLTNPWHAAWASMIAFTVGALLPLLTITLAPHDARVWVTVASVAIALAITGWLSARLGEAHVGRAVATQRRRGSAGHGRDVPHRPAGRHPDLRKPTTTPRRPARSGPTSATASGHRSAPAGPSSRVRMWSICSVGDGGRERRAGGERTQPGDALGGTAGPC